MFFRKAFAAAAFVTLTLGTSFAYADESTAEQMFQDGLAAMKKNDFPTACEAFKNSNKADPSPGTQINLAVCYEKQKLWASAWTWYRSAAGLAEQRQQAARQKTAEDSANRIKPSVHYIVIAVKDAPADMVVKRDGAEVIVTLSGKEVPLPIDPGDHTIDITSTKTKPYTKKVTMQDNPNTDRVDVQLEELPPDQIPTTNPGPGNTTIIEKNEVVNDGSTQRLVGMIIGGVGVLTAIGAVGVQVLALGQASDRDDLKKQQAAATGDVAKAAFNHSINSDNSAAKNDQLIAIILGAGALAMIAGGAVIYFTAPKAAKKKPTGWIMPTPLAAPGFGGFGLTGAF